MKLILKIYRVIIEKIFYHRRCSTELTFEEAITSYLKYVKLKNKRQSYRSIENRVNNYILKYFKDEKVNDLNCQRYLEWQIKIDELGLALSYKKTLHTCFVTFLNYCIKFCNLKENVAKTVGNFKGEIENKGNIWTLEEFNQFISVVDELIYNTLFKFLYFTGVRLGEALALTFEDLTDDTIYIHNNMTRFIENNKKVLTSTKTKKSTRTIRIDSLTQNELLALQKYYITNYENYNDGFFIFGGDKEIAPTTLTRKKNYYCVLANVKQIKIHEFRHSHACLLFQNNVPVDEISYRLGHSKLSTTTDIYLRFIPKDEKRVITTLTSLRC